MIGQKLMDNRKGCDSEALRRNRFPSLAMTINIFVQLLITSSFYFSPEATMNFNISLSLIFMPEVT